MRIYLDQIGCRLNYSEMETLAHRLRASGHVTVSAPEQAQVVVFNSCAVTGEAGRKSRQRVRQIHRANQAARIVLTGCWATLSPDAAGRLPGVALVANNDEKDVLPSLLESWSAELDDPDLLARMQPNGTPFTVEAVWERRGRTRAFVKVQDGCNNRCTFCVVTVARGESRSRPLRDVVAEVQRFVDGGVQEAVLTGVHLGSYGQDRNGKDAASLKMLVECILQDTDILRLRLSSLEPWDLDEDFFDLWSKWPHRLCPHIHLPLQAGTDKLLRSMARRCTVDSYRRLVSKARDAVSDLIITTDLIVGFPGETDADFAAGLEFVEEMRFAHAHIFPFSARPGTAAAGYGSHVELRTKKARSRQASKVVARTGNAERMRFLGTDRPVLWEGEGEKLADREVFLWTGLTDNYLRVKAESPSPYRLHNLVTPTHLSELHGDTFGGTVVESGAT